MLLITFLLIGMILNNHFFLILVPSIKILKNEHIFSDSASNQATAWKRSR